MPVFTSKFKMSKMHDFVHLLRLYFVIVWCPVVNQTQVICLCPTTKLPIYGRVRTGCCKCMHACIHTIWSIQKSLVYSSDGHLLGSNVKASSLGIRGMSLTRCRMFSVRGSSFREVHPYLFSTMNTEVNSWRVHPLCACTAYSTSYFLPMNYSSVRIAW